MRSLRALLITALAALALTTSGCILPNEGSREVAILPLDRPIRYVEEFDEAYAAPAADGGYQLVLSSGLRHESVASGQRIYPLPRNQSAQVLIIHVSWRPARGTKSDHPAATNSTIDWYVITDANSDAPSYARYSGIGFVGVELGGGSSLFTLQDVTVKAEEIVGKSKDPLGPSRISGIIRARNDEQRVRAVMAKLEEELAAGPPQNLPQPQVVQPPGMPPARRQGP